MEWLNLAVHLSLMVEAIFYGIYLITFFACLQRLLWKQETWKRVSDIDFKLLSVVIVLFVSSSLNQVVDLLLIAQYFDNSTEPQVPWFDVLKAGCTWLIRGSLLIVGCFGSAQPSGLPVSAC
jgi:hypothetical protein